MTAPTLLNDCYDHMSCDGADTIEQEIMNKLRRLNLISERAANIIFKKNIEAETLKRSIQEEHLKLNKIQQQIKQATIYQE